MKKLICASVLFLSSPVFATPSLNAVMTTKNLGQPLKSLGLGVSKESRYLTHEYTVSGCPLEVEVKDDAPKTIVALSIEVSPKCQSAQLNDVLGSKKLPSLSNLTFGQLDTLLGPARYTADCLKLCGNASDPYVKASWGSLTAEVILVDGPSIEASIRWGDAIEDQYGEDYIIDNMFNCSNEFDNFASEQFKNIKATRLILRKPSVLLECKKI